MSAAVVSKNICVYKCTLGMKNRYKCVLLLRYPAVIIALSFICLLLIDIYLLNLLTYLSFQL